MTFGSCAICFGLARGDDLAVVEHDAAVDDPHQHAHDVLDPDDGDAALRADAREHVGGLLHLGLVEAAQRLVRQQELGLSGERARELQLLQCRRAQAVDARGRIGRQAHQLERFARLREGLLARGAVLLTVVGGERDVLEERQAPERARDLMRAPDAVARHAIGAVPSRCRVPETRSSPPSG